MTLTFTQENGLYVAEFEATAPFSIHLERPKGGFINMLQRSVDSGTFVAVKNFNPNYNATQVIDADCGQGAVYPKWIRLESAVEPSVAEVTFEDAQSGGGAGTESTIEYLDLSGVDESKILGFVSFGILAKIPNAGIVPPTLFALENQVSDLRSTTAIAVDYGIEFIMGGMNMNVESLANNMGLDITSVPHLTKEQFYNLEA